LVITEFRYQIIKFILEAVCIDGSHCLTTGEWIAWVPAIKESYMKKSPVISQVYGYLVCIVAVITFLICISGLISAIIDSNDPIHADLYGSNQNLSSYESYKLDKLRSAQRTDSVSRAYVPDEQTIQNMYTAEKNEKIQIVKHRNMRAIVLNSIVLLVAVLLFATHWIWLRKLARTES
jgi:hypothetical protein